MRVLERADAMCVRSLSSRETRQRATQATAPIDRCSIQAKHGNQAGMWYVPDARAGTPVLVPCSRLQAVLVAGCEIEAVQAIMRT